MPMHYRSMCNIATGGEYQSSTSTKTSEVRAIINIEAWMNSLPRLRCPRWPSSMVNNCNLELKRKNGRDAMYGAERCRDHSRGIFPRVTREELTGCEAWAREKESLPGLHSTELNALSPTATTTKSTTTPILCLKSRGCKGSL